MFSTRVFRIYSEIMGIDANFDEDYASFQILRYLPRKYDGIVQTILRWKKEEFKFAKITDELVAEETMLKVCNFDRSREFHANKSAKHKLYSQKIVYEGELLEMWKAWAHSKELSNKESS